MQLCKHILHHYTVDIRPTPLDPVHHNPTAHKGTRAQGHKGTRAGGWWLSGSGCILPFNFRDTLLDSIPYHFGIEVGIQDVNVNQDTLSPVNT